MDSVVEVYNGEPRCGTFLIAEGFDRRHNEVLKLIKKYEQQFLDAESFTTVTVKLLNRKVKTAGRPVIEYLLNKEQTMFLGMLFRATAKPDDPVLKFKARLAKDFIRQEKIIKSLISNKQSHEWIENRASGKIARKAETDTIKSFIDYAELQGSKHANKYYMALTKCVNSSLFEANGKFKNLRETMTATQLVDVKFADRIVEKGLIEGMSLNMPYKEIYQLVKNRLIELAKMYGKSEVVSEQLIIE